MELSEKNSLNPNIWGSTFWDTLHLTCFGYPTNPNSTDKETYRQFIQSFVKILPCDKCSGDARVYIRDIPDIKWGDILKDKKSLVEWSWMFHNNINIKLNKQSLPMKDFVDGFIRSKEPLTSWYSKIRIILAFILLICISIFYARYLRTTR